MKDEFEKEVDEILSNDSDLFNEEFLNLNILNEKTVYRDSNICIAVTSDVGGRFQYLPYFKITDGTNASNGTKIARISFQNHEYIIHKDNMLHWEFTNNEIKIINSILSSKGKEGKTIYDDLIYAAADICGISYNRFITKYNISNNPSIDDIHYRNQIDRAKAKAKGISK